MRRGKRGRYLERPVLDTIEKYIEKGWGPTQIYKHLQENINLKGKVPCLRTIQSIVRDSSAHDSTEPWKLAGSDAEDAALILPVLAAIIEATEGGRIHLTQAEAGWVMTLRTVAPDLPPFEVYRLARFYMAREYWKRPSSDLDALLAFAPWRSEERREAYVLALQEEWFPEVPMMAPGLFRDYDGIPGDAPDGKVAP